MSDSITASRLEQACEELLVGAVNAAEVTVRRIALRAGTNIAAVNYHFGSVEKLIFSVGNRVYLRLNAERLALLQQAVQRARPDPAPAGELIAALVGPSVRWSLDPGSSYRVLKHITTIAQSSQNPEIFQPMVEDIQHHRSFIPHFRRVAPWLGEAEIGFRISCILGIRSQLIRNRSRTETLTDHAFDLGDPDVVLSHLIAVTVPMFAAPTGADPNSVSNSSLR